MLNIDHSDIGGRYGFHSGCRLGFPLLSSRGRAIYGLCNIVGRGDVCKGGCVNVRHSAFVVSRGNMLMGRCEGIGTTSRMGSLLESLP